MPVSYTCPNTECGVTLKTPSRVAVGKSVKCPKCQKPFVPEPGAKEEPKPADSGAPAPAPAKEEPKAAGTTPPAPGGSWLYFPRLS